mgnify:FL=1
MKSFKIGAILTVTTGILLCDVGGLYEILNHLTGDNLFTHQLPRAATWAAPKLLAQFPALQEVTAESLAGTNRQNVEDKVRDIATRFDSLASDVRVPSRERRRMARVGVRRRQGCRSVKPTAREVAIAPLDGWGHVDPVTELIMMRAKASA